MKWTLLYTIFTSLAAVSFGEVTTVTTSELSIGKNTVNSDGETLIPVVEVVGGKSVTYHFSVVDGATVFVADSVNNAFIHSFAKQEAKETQELESYLQEVVGAIGNEINESASYKSQSSMSLSDVVRRAAQASSSIQ
ncbi:unnamed protein product [Mucor hiemalis]